MKQHLLPISICLLFSIALGAQNSVGIGTATPHPSALLHLNSGEGASNGFLVSGPLFDGAWVPNLGRGSRLMFYPGKAAFRAGYVNGTQWDNANVGSFSTAIGHSTIASDYYSFASGINSRATGTGAAAFGSGSSASGTTAMALGHYTSASGQAATAMGSYTVAKGYCSLVAGMHNDSLLTTDEAFLARSTTTPIFIVGVGESGAPSNAFVVRKDGRVVVGNDTRNGRLSVVHTSNVSSPTLLLYDNNAGNFARLQFQNASGNKYWHMAGYTDNAVDGNSKLNFYYSGGSAFDVMSLSGNGNVGIGTNNPLQKLHVVGSICYTGSSAACSDIRYKTNLQPVGSTLSSLMQIQPIYYNWKQQYKEKGFTGERQLGFSAQEVEQFFPEIVQTDKEGYKAVDYSRMTPVLVQAVKELKTENDALKANLSVLEQQNRDLNARLEKLEKLLPAIQ